MSNNEFIEILKNINKKIIMNENATEIISYINSRILKIENDTDCASEYIESLIKKLK